MQAFLKNRREGVEDALLLVLVELAAKQVGETRLTDSRSNVLPAVRGQHLGMNGRILVRTDRPPADRCEVVGVRLGLLLQRAVDAEQQCDQIVDGGIALALGKPLVFPVPLELIDDRVLRFFLPVEEEDIFEQRR